MGKSRCMNCMKGMLDESGRCTVCGKRQEDIRTSSRHLPLYTILAGKYLIGKVLGEGGFGITYLGYDLNLEIPVAIKEFCPRDFASREVTDGLTLTPFDEECTEFYEEEKGKFIGEAKRLAKFRNQPCIVSVQDYFQENATAYIVMEYIDGQPLKKFLKEMGHPMKVEVILPLLKPVFEALQAVHEAGIIHRDISPDNIMLTNDYKQVYLIDFGTARMSDYAGERSLSVYKKGSYTPVEQQSRRGNQGPWTDIYALCATIYLCITGKNIPEAVDRVMDDMLLPPSQFGIEIAPHVEEALLQGLAVKPEQRIQSVAELAERLYHEPKVQEQSTQQTAESAETESLTVGTSAEPKQSVETTQTSEKTSEQTEAERKKRLTEILAEEARRKEAEQEAVEAAANIKQEEEQKFQKKKTIWTIVAVLLLICFIPVSIDAYNYAQQQKAWEEEQEAERQKEQEELERQQAELERQQAELERQDREWRVAIDKALDNYTQVTDNVMGEADSIKLAKVGVTSSESDDVVMGVILDCVDGVTWIATYADILKESEEFPVLKDDTRVTFANGKTVNVKEWKGSAWGELSKYVVVMGVDYDISGRTDVAAVNLDKELYTFYEERPSRMTLHTYWITDNSWSSVSRFAFYGSKWKPWDNYIPDIVFPSPDSESKYGKGNILISWDRASTKDENGNKVWTYTEGDYNKPDIFWGIALPSDENGTEIYGLENILPLLSHAIAMND